MENASKALIIAGEVLIGVLVVSLIGVVIATFGRFSFNMNSRIEQNRVLIFNNHFTSYDGRIDITAQEIAGLLNFAKQSNDNYELDANGKTVNGKASPYFVEIKIDGRNFFQTASNYSNLNNDIINFVQGNNTKYFCCNVDLNNTRIQNKNGKNIIKVARKDKKDIVFDNSTGMITMIKFTTVNKEDFNVMTRSNYEIE